jgi:hypothetical protein
MHVRQHEHDPDEDQLREQRAAVGALTERAPRVPVGRHVAAGRDQHEQRDAADDREAAPDRAKERDPIAVGEGPARDADGETEEDEPAGPDGSRDQVQRAD